MGRCSLWEGSREGMSVFRGQVYGVETQLWSHTLHVDGRSTERSVGNSQKRVQLDKTNQVEKNGAETSNPNCKGDEVKPLRDPAGVAGSPGNPKSKSAEDSGDPVLSDKIQLQKKIQEADEGRFTYLHLT
ncbi:hypothetical protein MG293_020694 [Ovis ammon polii]|uniref:Uncharacterized protein n=1 Tax=Ovis ammon polii TaxID=230172 RepID=A0AAD4TM61_OVIAM|nr:hypothetical protein MG293_020694 [Ovis ammon polii]